MDYFSHFLSDKVDQIGDNAHNANHCINDERETDALYILHTRNGKTRQTKHKQYDHCFHLPPFISHRKV